MRRITGRLLWLFVFTIPWDVVTIAGVGTLSRMLGILTIGVAALTTAMEARFRKPGTVLWLAIAFTVWSVLTLLWTISLPMTVERVWTYGQLLGSAWVVQEFARTREQRESLLLAFCVGCFVPMASLLANFNTGIANVWMQERFTSSGALRLNANDLGLTLVIGIPIAWHLVILCRGVRRVTTSIYFIMAPFAILLTGTRGAFLAGLVALSIVPVTVSVKSTRSFASAALLVISLAVTVAFLVPQFIWARIATIEQELLGEGNMTGRVDIWKAGWQVFLEQPLLGVGAGAYEVAVEPLLFKRYVSHNVPLAVLVEQGVVGFSIFVGLLSSCAWTIVGLPSQDRKVWAVLMLAWLVGVMSLNWEARKVTWLLFGLLAAQRSLPLECAEQTAMLGARPMRVPLREWVSSMTTPG